MHCWVFSVGAWVGERLSSQTLWRAASGNAGGAGGPALSGPPWAVQRRGRRAGPAEQPSGSSAQRSRACFPGMGPSFQGLSGRNGLSSSSLWGFAQGWPGGGGTGERVSRGLGPLGVSPEHAVLGAGLQGPGLSSPLAETGWLSPCPASRRDCFSESQRL